MGFLRILVLLDGLRFQVLDTFLRLFVLFGNQRVRVTAVVLGADLGSEGSEHLRLRVNLHGNRMLLVRKESHSSGCHEALEPDHFVFSKFL